MARVTIAAAPGRARTLLGFSAFGLFWGSWGAALPAVQAHAGVDDGVLGLALLCIGAGALASMRPAGGRRDDLRGGRRAGARGRPRAAPAPGGEGRPAAAAARGLRALLHVPGWLAVLGALTALAYFVENARQSWSAVHLEGTLGAAPAVAAAGPALFAAAAATGRLLGQAAARRVEDRALVGGGAVLAAAGRCSPRPRRLSIVTTLAYLGCLVGPATVGLAADALSLRAALGAVAGLALVLAATVRLAPPGEPARAGDHHPV